jgi:hypothetical protein
VAVFLVGSPDSLRSRSSCDDRELLLQAESLLATDPIEAIPLLESARDCDEKFALLYQADAKIASQAREEFFYAGKVNPRGWYDQEPTSFEKYLMEHTERFNSASEGMYAISANDFWLSRIKDRSHPVIGDYEFRKIQLFDEAVWEDGDGSMHSKKLIEEYKNWINRFPGHKHVPLAEKWIQELEKTPEIP